MVSSSPFRGEYWGSIPHTASNSTPSDSCLLRIIRNMIITIYNEEQRLGQIYNLTEAICLSGRASFFNKLRKCKEKYSLQDSSGKGLNPMRYFHIPGVFRTACRMAFVKCASPTAYEDTVGMTDNDRWELSTSRTTKMVLGGLPLTLSEN